MLISTILLGFIITSIPETKLVISVLDAAATLPVKSCESRTRESACGHTGEFAVPLYSLTGPGRAPDPSHHLIHLIWLEIPINKRSYKYIYFVLLILYIDFMVLEILFYGK